VGRAPKLFIAVAILYGVLDRRAAPGSRSCVASSPGAFRIEMGAASASISTRPRWRGARIAGQGRCVDAWRDSDISRQREAALDYAEAMTDSTRRASDATVDGCARSSTRTRSWS